MAPKLLFLHIPKTGGTTFSTFLASHLGPQNCSDGLNATKFRDALTRYGAYKLISGHLYPEIGDRLPVDRESLVILRDPLDRFLSTFYFQRNDVSDIPLAREDVERSTDLGLYIESLSESDCEILNLQTQMLYPLEATHSPPNPWATKVASAKRALDCFQMVGIQSELEDFAAMVSRRMGWKHKGDVGHAKVTSHRIFVDDLKNSHRERLAELLAPDLELFEYALARFRRDRRGKS